jgi:ligand-binding sensor domain-containing protein/signal transduction histidine kinase
MSARLSLRNLSSGRNRLARPGLPRRLAGAILCPIALGLIALGLIAPGLIAPAYAIDPGRAMSQYVRDYWGTEQGFPKGPVYAITQTRDGYLWIGTSSGLVRFDGWNFQLMQDPSGVFPRNAAVLGLAAGSDGGLWILLMNQVLVRYSGGVFQRMSLAGDPYANISALGRSRRGRLLLSKMDQGTFEFDGKRFERLTSADELPRSPVIALTQTAAGDLWLGTRDAGLFHLAGGRMTSVRSGLPDLKINCLLADGDRNMLVGTDDGIVGWNGTRLMPIGPTAALGRFQVLAITRDRDDNVWVGTDSRGLLRMNSHGIASLQEPDGVTHEAVTAVFEDRERDLWIAGSDGIERLRDSPFVTYSSPEGLPTDGSKPVFAGSDHRVWFGPPGGGLWWIDGKRHGHVSADGLDHDVVYSIAGGAGQLWLGRRNEGLTRLQDHDGSIAARTYTKADGLAQNSVYSVYLARDESVWAGTLSAGVSVFRNDRFKNYTIANGLASNTVASILQASDGTMWFATPSGLSAFADGRWRTYTAADGLPTENVNCLLQDPAGVLWVGTASGIAFGGKAGFHVPATMPAELRGQILGIAEDRFGWLWMATSGHVLRVNREKLLNGTLASGDLRAYGMADGLRGIQGVKRAQSVVADPEGRIWFSLNRGISVVDPARLNMDAEPVIVHMQGLTADGDPIAPGGSLHVPGGRRRVTFRYVGLSLSIPDRVRYRYRLDGFDRGWSEPVAGREAIYTNLSPGSYRFRVMGTNSGGVWGRAAALDFEVDPLLWETWWFRALVVLACIGCILALYRMRLRQITTQIGVRFEERLAERTRIAQELHDTLLQGFLSASMQVHVAVDRLPDDSPVKPGLKRALELMRQVIDEGRNAVRGLRSSETASLDLERAFSRIQQELALGERPGERAQFRVIVDGEQRPLHPVLRDEVYRIGREALTNAFRHAHAKKIEIELRYTTNRLGVFVRDDGCGIDPNVLRTGRDGHWGLSGMRERADRIGARLHVMSSPSAGTEVELSVPGNVAFESRPDRKWRWFGGGRAPNRNGDRL